MQGDRNTIHKNLVINLLVANVLFLAGISQHRMPVSSLQHQHAIFVSVCGYSGGGSRAVHWVRTTLKPAIRAKFEGIAVGHVEECFEI